MSSDLITVRVHGRYLDGKKFKADLAGVLSPMSAVSYAVGALPGVRVVLAGVPTSVKEGKQS